jgi:hypothetical protein
MKRCTAVYAGRLPLTGFGVQIQPRRWRSYDKSTLTQDALLEQVESQLGHDLDGKPLRVDPDAKTVTTATGSLPISPIMDPAWIKTKRRPKKSDPGKISGQFRKKLSNNPFGMKYATALLPQLSNPSHSRSPHDTNPILPNHQYYATEILLSRYRSRITSRIS